MNRNTKIQWTDMTWNPIIGCHKISPGCENCYAEKMANRISHMDTWIGEQYREVIGLDGKWNWETHVADSHMDFPKIKKPKRVFVGSMTDIFFHSQRAEGRVDITRLFSVFAQHPQHTFQILTKRPVEMNLFLKALRDITESKVLKDTWKWPLPNVWLGVTVCNQEEANFKIPILLDTPAAKRFISIEPMLGPIDLSYMPDKNWVMNAFTGISTYPTGSIIHNNLDWIIVGAETGQKARPIEHNWVAVLARQAQLNKIPLFFKSWGKNDIHDWRIEALKQFPV